MGQRVSHCVELRVVATERITPRMTRVRLGGSALAGFRSVSPDQQVKLFFAKPGQERPVVPPMPASGDVQSWFQAYQAMPEPLRPWMRSYTVRRHHPGRGEVDVDFVLHEPGQGEEGPAAGWARTARVGTPVGLLGPAASHHTVVSDHDWRLLVGDESALPAIAALLEADPTVPTLAFVEVADAAERQSLAGGRVHWLYRNGVPGGRSGLLLDAVRAARFPGGLPFAWVAGESATVRALRRHLVGERGLDRKRVAFSGYWRRGRGMDDELTTEEAAERAEILAELAERDRG